MKYRSLWKVAILGFVTFGIYDLYWLISTRRELIRNGQPVPSILLIFAPLIGLAMTAVVTFVSLFVLNDAVAQPAGALTAINIAAIMFGLLSVIALIPAALYWLYRYCKAAERATGGKASFGTSFGLAVVLSVANFSFLWPVIIQDAYNELSPARA